jgi:hypothetical protein
MNGAVVRIRRISKNQKRKRREVEMEKKMLLFFFTSLLRESRAEQS